MENNLLNDKQRLKLINRVFKITIILNIILAIIKILAGYYGKSTALLADGLHSTTDIITSIGLVIGVLYSTKPSDDKHQYGHEKAEAIAALILSIILALIGVNIGFQSIKIIILKTYSIPNIYTIYVTILSIFIKEYQYRITIKTAKAVNSNALRSDAWHHRTDAFSSIAALIGILGARFGYLILDPLAGTIVSIIVVKISIDLIISSVDDLMDVSLDSEIMNKLINNIEDLSKVKKVTVIRGRKHGSKVYIDIRICVNPKLTVLEGHDIGKDVEELIKDKIINIKEVLVHVDPCLYNNNEKCSPECYRLNKINK